MIRPEVIRPKDLSREDGREGVWELEQEERSDAIWCDYICGFSAWIYSSEFRILVLSRLIHLIFAGTLSRSEAAEKTGPLLRSLMVPRSLCFSPSCTCVLPPSLLFPGSSLVGYNAGSQPALQTDGPLIRCASALPLLPAARFLIKLKPKEEQEREIDGEGNRVREKQREGEEGGVLGSILACFGVSYLFE